VAVVLLVRHARTGANTEGRLAGSAPVDLDEVGVATAQALGVRLAGVALRAVVSSPLLRCRRTLALALPDHMVQLEPRLTECGYGEWQGRPLRELATEALWSTVQHHPSAVSFPGGESMAAMSARAVAAIRDWNTRIESAHGPDAVWLACSHGDVIKSIVADALGLHLDLFQRIAIDPASISVIRYTPHRAFLVRLNETGTPLQAFLAPPPPDARAGGESDAPVGGGAGPSPVPAAASPLSAVDGASPAGAVPGLVDDSGRTGAAGSAQPAIGG
jgi:probable phosphomutase (TIGR03848 family)